MTPGFRRVQLTSREPLRFHSLPKYLVFTSAEELGEAYGVSASSAEAGVDWDREFLVVAQREECPTGGYSITIEGLNRPAPDELRVTVSRSDPGPADFVTMVITYPRDVVAVSRRGLEGVRKVTFVDPGGRVLRTVEVDL